MTEIIRFHTGDLVEVAYFTFDMQDTPVWNVNHIQFPEETHTIIWVPCIVTEANNVVFQTQEIEKSHPPWRWSQPSTNNSEMLKYIRKKSTETERSTKTRVDNIIRRIHGLHPHPHT